MNKRNILLAVALVLIVGVIYYLDRPTTVTLNTGEKVAVGVTTVDRSTGDVGTEAPGFLLSGFTESKMDLHRLADYRGKKVLLNFWASWCPFCVDEMPLFQTVYDEYRDKGLEVVAVNRGEDVETAKEFADQFNLTYPLLLDQSDEVYGAFQGRSMPVSFLIDESGVIQERKFGPYSEDELRTMLSSYFDDTDITEPPEDMPYQEPGGDIPIEDFKPEKPMDEEPVIEESLKSTRPISVTDDIKHSVPLKDIRSGGPRKDGIPSIDNPEFISVKEANKFVNDDGLGIAVSADGIDRFYPNQILVWHEIVNDNIGDQSLLVTYCPLCGTGVVFDPMVNGKASEFGTSGKLWNSNLVMYDRQTDSYWSQALGEAIVGEMTGAKLRLVPHDNLLYKDWKKEHPKGQVLSKNTGETRNYAQAPYGDYATNRSLFFPTDNNSDLYHPKEPTWGVELNGEYQAYVLEELNKGPAEFTDEVGGVSLTIKFDKDRQIIDIRRENGEEVVPFYSFWFSWFSVRPDTGIWLAN